ncbi:MAG: riboflavin synthase, partial [Candidatus Aminicenantes bacterium]|nr:riboflavin synthase [Candidatus Aminicenantes bacterium]
MFTGIIVSTGLFKGYRRGRHEMQLEAADLAPKLEPGASLAVNGVCLSLVSKDKGGLVFDLSQETLGRTNLGALRPGARLNLELPLTLGSLVGGHLVSGHIDAVGKVVRLTEKRPGKRL